MNILDLIDLGSQVLSFLFRIYFIYNSDHLGSTLQILYHFIQVEANQHKAVDDHQTSHCNTHSSERHKPMLEGGFHTLPQQVKEISLPLHSCNTHPFRR